MEIQAHKAKPGYFLSSDRIGRSGIIQKVVIPEDRPNSVVLMCERDGNLRNYEFQLRETIEIVKIGKTSLVK